MTSSLRSQVEKNLRALNVVARNETILIAMSGGPDSLALAGVLADLRVDWSLQLHAATVHHGLRDSAMLDCDIANKQAQALRIPITTLPLQVEPGASVMERARNERYLALLTHAKSLSAAYVAVGHTEDDQAETVLMRLLRGTSVLGLASIQGVRADGVVRPLLRSSRAHVHGYANRIARELDVPIAYDPTNQDAKYLRTRTRALLNQLRTENGNVGKNLGRLAEEAHELRVWLELQAEVWCEQHVQEQGLPHRVWAALANPLRKSVVRHWCKKTFAIDLEHENLESIMKVRSSSDIPLAHDLRIRLRDGFICGVFSQTPNQVL